LVVEEAPDRRWRLVKPLSYQGRDEPFEVPEGFETDFASVPRVLWSLIPTYGRYTKAAVLHDYLCRKAADGEFNRCDADGLFRRTMRELGVGLARRRMMWAAVRWAGGLDQCSFGDAALVVLITLLALPLIIPAIVTFLFLLGLWLVDLIFWQIGGGNSDDRPTYLPRR
jgi:hypothetical protein